MFTPPPAELSETTVRLTPMDGVQASVNTDEDAESASLLVSSEQATLPTTRKNMVHPVRFAAVVAVITCLGFAGMQLAPAEHSAKPAKRENVVSLNSEFCDSPWKQGINAQDVASTAVCESVCPCCSGKPLPHFDCAADEDAPGDASKALQQKWELDDNASPRQLVIKSGAEFLKTLSKSAAKKYSWKEVLNHTFWELAPSQAEQSVKMWTDIQTKKGWSDPEMAMFGYSTEAFYGPMNKMLRQARSMADIDDWTQSYIAILYDGLENYAQYINAATYRGMSNCDGTQFHEGEKGLLPQFTSTSMDKRVALKWARPCKDQNRLVVYFTGGGYDISKYSYYPGERELLLEPGREFVVGSVETVTCANPVDKKELPYTVVHRLTNGPTQLNVHMPDKTKPQYKCPEYHLKSCEVCSCCPIPEPLGKA